MFLGHFALAMAAKKAAPKASLGTLVFSAQFADLIWPLLLFAGAEHVRIVPGLMAASPLEFVSYPISHSLAMQLIWGAVIGGVYFWMRGDAWTAAVVGLLLPTHWLLDFFAHRPDMPIYPGGPKYGLGMWNSVGLTLAVEYGLFVAGILLYESATRKRGERSEGFWSLVIFLGVLYAISLYAPPPPNVRVLATTALAMWLTVPWAVWADRQREPRAAAPAHP